MIMIAVMARMRQIAAAGQFYVMMPQSFTAQPTINVYLASLHALVRRQKWFIILIN